EKKERLDNFKKTGETGTLFLTLSLIGEVLQFVDVYSSLVGNAISRLYSTIRNKISGLRDSNPKLSS
ncbi:hypothetical protein HID58_081357, partial [Brassica napus]